MNQPAGCLPVGAVLLAAGSATRMGTLKQLLPFRGRTLIEHAVGQAIEAGLEPLIVVVGAEGAAIRYKLASKPVAIVENKLWQSGMGSSIAAGVRHLQELEAGSAAVAILLADQPLVGAGHLSEMRSLFARSEGATVAARYNDTLGVPAFFKREMFSALACLQPAEGARTLLRGQGHKVIPFDLPEAAVDIDTPEDFAALES
ncbi:MAG: nucleotidyltransferase family protein [Acidobacteriota bacterium]|nr:nucleotidyltransferase family protein [Acidobacteriota bacterium]